LSDELKLKPCPWCDSDELTQEAGYGVWCRACDADGPKNDPGGDRWNALPRRVTPTAAQMSDGEMIARALRELSTNVVEAASAVSMNHSAGINSDYQLQNEIARREMERDTAKAAVKP
jgi:hypothetical protein